MSNMLKITVSPIIEQLHYKYFKEHILSQKNKIYDGYIIGNSIRKTLDGILETLLQDEGKKIAIGDFQTLESLYQKIQNDWEKMKNEMIGLNNGKGIPVSDIVSDFFGYKGFVDYKFKKNDYSLLRDEKWREIRWNPYIWVQMLGIRVCPYCNRSYITTLITNEHKTRADIDHFLPKSEYPFFSMSLYNWVPSCRICNSSLKNIKSFDFGDPIPYDTSYDECFYFEYHKSDFKEKYPIEICVKVRDNKIDKILKTFAIKDIYQNHTDVAWSLCRKKLAYSDSFLKSLRKMEYDLNFGECIGYPEQQSQIDDDVLGKLKRDIAIQVGFIDNPHVRDKNEIIAELEGLVKAEKDK